MTGDITLGNLWLTRAGDVKAPLEKAWYHGLKAEVAKSRGLKQEALDEIERAIATLASQPLDAKEGYMVDNLKQSPVWVWYWSGARVCNRRTGSHSPLAWYVSSALNHGPEQWREAARRPECQYAQ